MLNRFTTKISRNIVSWNTKSLFPHNYRYFSVCGMDIGTTTSCAAIMDGESPKIISNSEGMRTTPSYVAWSKAKNGKVEKLVGASAKRQSELNPQNTVYAAKRLIGMRYDDPEIKKLQEMLPYKIVKNTNGDAWIYVPHSNENYSPSQIASFVIDKLRNEVNGYTSTTLEDVVITVPAYFNDSQRSATKAAGKIAGLNVLRIINEPTAAALAYGLERANVDGNNTQKDRNIVVYDLGGGTFDISILKISDGVFEVLSTNGNTHLGGEDFDNRLIEYICDDFKNNNDFDLKNDDMAIGRVKQAAEVAKIELSSSMKSDINIPYITADPQRGPLHVDTSISKSKFENLVDDLIKSTLEPCKIAMDDAKLNNDDISEIILVGGMTRMPKVQRVVSEFFNQECSKSVNPDEVVAMGAAYQASMLTGDTKGVGLIDVLPLSLGIETLGGAMCKIMPKNIAIPTKMTEIFSTACDNQHQVGIKIAQGERTMFKDNKFLGHFDLVGIKPAPRGEPEIEVSFDVDMDGLLTVTAVDKQSGKAQEIRVEGSSGLSDEEIKRMVDEAERYAEEDQAKREEKELINTAETLLWQSEHQFEEYKGTVEDELETEFMEAIKNLRNVKNDDNLDVGKLKGCVNEMNIILNKVGQSVYGEMKKDDIKKEDNQDAKTQPNAE